MIMGKVAQLLREGMLILLAFVCGFYVGYFYVGCAPIINQSMEVMEHVHPLNIAMDSKHPSIINNSKANDENNLLSISIKSNLFDEVYEWQYFKNRNTETSPYTVPHHKIVFCGIPKNAISMWKMVLLRLHNKEWWLASQGKIHAMLNGLGEYRLWDKNFSFVENIMNDDEWYKAVFIRDPLERALSAVLDKGYTVNINWSTFDEYLTQTSMTKGIHMIDQHFRPQHKFCDLYKYADKYHIFSFHTKNHRKIFFDDIGNGLYDKYGATGWSKADHNGQNKNGTKHNIVEFQNIFPSHSKKSSTHILKSFTIKKTAFLLRYYQYDYILFNLSLPEWICQVISNEYEQMTILMPQQIHRKNAIRLKKTNNLRVLRTSVVVYSELLQLYVTLKIFPSYLQPTCMPLLTHCVQYGECPQTFK